MALVTEETSTTLDAEVDRQLQPDEMQNLGLKQQPFSSAIDSNKLFHDPQIEMASNICAEYLQHPSLSILLLGEAGSGKTSLLRQLLLRSLQQTNYCVLRASKDQTYPEIYAKLVAQWGDPAEPAAADSALIKAILSRANHSAAVLIDDADKLSVDTLVALMRLKSRLQREHQITLGLLFAGQSFLKNTLSECEKIDADSSSTYQVNLRPLSQEQSENYIQQRLTGLTENKDELLSAKEIAAITKVSAGNFIQIQTWVLRALRARLAGEPFKPQRLTEEGKNQSLLYSRWFWYVCIAAALVLILLAIIFARSTPPSATEKEVYNLSLPSSDQTLTTKLTKAKAKPAISSPAIDSSQDSGAATTEAQHKAAPNHEKTASALNGMDWLQTVATERYTLQLVATRKVKNLDIIKKHHLSLPSAYFEKPIDGVTFYILVMGDFKSTSEAKQTIASLPQELQVFEPWPIAIASLQKYIQ